MTHHYLIVVFAGTSPDRDPIAGDDAAAVTFAALDELPRFGLSSRTLTLITTAYSMVTA